MVPPQLACIPMRGRRIPRTLSVPSGSRPARSGAHIGWALLRDRGSEGGEGRGIRILISALRALLIAAPAAAGWLDGSVDGYDGKLGLLAGVEIARGPEEWAFDIQVGQAWGR